LTDGMVCVTGSQFRHFLTLTHIGIRLSRDRKTENHLQIRQRPCGYIYSDGFELSQGMAHAGRRYSLGANCRRTLRPDNGEVLQCVEIRKPDISIRR